MSNKVVVVGPFGDCASCYFGKYSPHKDVDVTVTVLQGLNQSLNSDKAGTGTGVEVSAVSGCEDSYSCTQYSD